MAVQIPTIMETSGLDAEVQTVEIVESRVLVRFRAMELVESGRHRTRHPALMDERLRLTDSRGVSVEVEQKSSASGPFIGIVDMAFPLLAGFDLSSQVQLTSERLSVAFRL